MTTAKTAVLNLRNLPKRIDNAVYIGRGSPWGNPFTVKNLGREGAIAAYRKWLWKQEGLMARLPELHGKKLLCFCAPHACHGDVLVAAVNWKMADAKREAAELKATAAGKRLAAAGYTAENIQP